MNDDDKDIDLHPSEWRHEGEREPIFGPGFRFDPFEVVAFVLCAAGLIWFVKSGGYEALRLWIASLIY